MSTSGQIDSTSLSTVRGCRFESRSLSYTDADKQANYNYERELATQSFSLLRKPLLKNAIAKFLDLEKKGIENIAVVLLQGSAQPEHILDLCKRHGIFSKESRWKSLNMGTF